MLSASPLGAGPGPAVHGRCPTRPAIPFRQRAMPSIRETWVNAELTLEIDRLRIVARRILVVDRDQISRNLLVTGLSHFLGLDGYEIVGTDSEESCLRAARKYSPALTLFSLGGPDFDGLELFKRLRRETATSRIPVVVIAASDSEAQEVLFLDQGVEDYISWSSAMKAESLFARCRALLRRGSEAINDGPKVIRLGGLTANPDAKRVIIGRKTYDGLAVKEFEVLCCLAKHHPKPINRRRLFREVWPHRRRELPAPNTPLDEKVDWERPIRRKQVSVSLKTVGVHVARLRKKLGKGRIKNIRGKGYVLVPPA